MHAFLFDGLKGYLEGFLVVFKRIISNVGRSYFFDDFKQPFGVMLRAEYLHFEPMAINVDIGAMDGIDQVGIIVHRDLRTARRRPRRRANDCKLDASNWSNAMANDGE